MTIIDIEEKINNIKQLIHLFPQKFTFSFGNFGI